MLACGAYVRIKVLINTYNNTHHPLGFQLCSDAIPAFSANTLSLKPVQLFNWSLPPSIRGKIEYMLLLMLLPAHFKHTQQQKYWDFAASYELNDLFHRGVAGVKAKVFSTSMDTPGRAELLGKSPNAPAPNTQLSDTPALNT